MLGRVRIAHKATEACRYCHIPDPITPQAVSDLCFRSRDPELLTPASPPLTYYNEGTMRGSGPREVGTAVARAFLFGRYKSSELAAK